VFSLPNLEMLAVTRGARSNVGDDGRAQGLELLKGDGFVDAEEAGPVRGVPDDEMRDVGCGEAPGDAEIPKAPRLAAEGRAGPVRDPMRLISANAQLSSQNSASEISETHAPPSPVFSLGILRAPTAVCLRS
jgi:hypothetical protein